MSAPLSDLLESLTPPAPPVLTQIETDANTLLYTLVVFYQDCSRMAETVSALCRRSGRTAMLAGMSEAHATAAGATLAAIEQAWPLLSAATMPAWPNDADPPAEPEQPETPPE